MERNSPTFTLIVLSLLMLFLMAGCNPYAGFKGVSKKGMSNNRAPSQELRDDYKKQEKRMKRKYKRQMKKRAKRMGTTKDK